MMKPIVLLLFLSLTACAGSQQFDCPYKEGARCLSVGEIDQKINTGQLDLSQKTVFEYGCDRYGNRTRVTAVKGRCPNR